MSNSRKIHITDQDLERLRAIIESAGKRDAESAQLLEEELDRAVILPQNKIPPDVVTMNSRVVFEDLKTGEQRAVTLVYPRNASPDRLEISVLAPVGAALLGLKVGQSIRWPLPGNRTAELRIVSVEYQPEASGDLHL